MNNTKLLVYQGPPDYTGFSLHTSATDIPVAIWWGQRRITVNVVWVSALQPQASDAAGNPTTQSFGFTPLDGLPFPVNDQSGDIAWPMIFALGEGPMTGPIAISGTATLQHGNASFTFSVAQTLPAGTVLLFSTQPNKPYMLASTLSSSTAGTLTQVYDDDGTSGIVTASVQTCPVQRCWDGQRVFVTVGDLPADYEVFTGASGQAVWDWLFRANYTADQRLSYPFIAYVASGHVLTQGVTPAGSIVLARMPRSIPQQSFECTRIPNPGYARASSPLQLAGTAGTTNLSNAVTFSSPQTLAAGTLLQFSTQLGYYYIVASSVTSSTTATLTAPYSGPSNGSNTVSTVPGYDYSFADIIVDLLTSLRYGMGLSSGDIDSTSLAVYFAYTASQGLYFSPYLKSQEKVIDIIDRWAQLSNTWIFWDGTVLRFVPLGDVALSGNGQTYTPDLTPAYALGLSDFLGDTPVTVTRKDPSDCYNRVVLQWTDRSVDYGQNTVEYKDQFLIDIYGIRDASSVQGDEVCDIGVATTVVNLIGKRLSYIRNTYEFTLSYRYIRLIPGSLVTLTEPNIGLNAALVRIQSIEEDGDGRLKIVAEEVPGTTGIATPQGGTMGSATGSSTNQQIAPPSINPPAIFEPSSALSGATPEVIIAASGKNGGANWGGCFVDVSLDNVNFTTIGKISSPGAYQGALTANLPSHADPDTSSTLAPDMSQSREVPTGVTHADADAYRTLSIVEAQPSAGGGGVTGVMASAWELLSYGAVAQGAGLIQDLTYLRRGLYGSTIANHSPGQQFTKVDPSGLDGTTIVWPLAAPYIGQTLYFRFRSYNYVGQATQAPGVAPVYEYTTLGTGYGGGTGGVPATPTGLAATGGAGFIQVTWNANAASDNVTSYTLYRAPGLSASFGSASVIWTGLSTSYNDVGLAPSTSYTYFLVATNTAGASPHTAGVGATTLATGAVSVFTGVDVVTDPAHPDNAHAYVVGITGPAGSPGSTGIRIAPITAGGVPLNSLWLGSAAAAPAASVVSGQLHTNAILSVDGSGNVYMSTATTATQSIVLQTYGSGSQGVAIASGFVGAVAQGRTSISGADFRVSDAGGAVNFSMAMQVGAISGNRYVAFHQYGTGITSGNFSGTSWDGVFWIGNAPTPPASSPPGSQAPVGGALLYADSGALWVYQASGAPGTQRFQIQPGSSIVWADDLSGSNNSAQWVAALSGSGGGGGSIALASNAWINASAAANTKIIEVGGTKALYLDASSNTVLDSPSGGPATRMFAGGNPVADFDTSGMAVYANGGGYFPIYWKNSVAGAGNPIQILGQTSTGAQSGHIELYLDQPGGGTAEAALRVMRRTSPLWWLQALPGVGTTSALYSGVATPSGTNYILAQDSGGGLQFNDGGSGNISINFSDVEAVNIAPTLMSIGPALQGFSAPLLFSLSSVVNTSTSGTIDLAAGGYTVNPVILCEGTQTGDLILKFPSVATWWLVDKARSSDNGHSLQVSTATSGPIQISGPSFARNLAWIYVDTLGTIHSLAWQ